MFLIAFSLLIAPVNCGVYKHANSSLATVAARCSDQGSPCDITYECCQSGQELACSSFDNDVPKYCGVCAQIRVDCNPSDSACCTGFSCVNDANSKFTCQKPPCLESDEVCYPGIVPVCCDGLKCITVDAESYPICSPCAEDYTPCSSQNYCCGTSPCTKTAKNSFCGSCGTQGDSCNYLFDTCCDDQICDSSSNMCCTTGGKSCNPSGPGSCCYGQKCVGSGTEATCQACIDSGGKCNAGSDLCCDDTQRCDGNENSLTCRTPCVQTGTPCVNQNDPCCDTGLACYGEDNALICRNECIKKDEPCTSETDLCCTPGLTCNTDGGQPLACRKPCVPSENPCSPDSDTCCETGFTCQSKDGGFTCQKKCIAEGATCASTSATCCDNTKACKDIGGTITCQPKCVENEATCLSTSDICCDASKTCTDDNGSLFCKPKCGKGGESCSLREDNAWRWGTHASGTCCSGLTCDSTTHKCCTGVDAACSSDASCCHGLKCDNSNICKKIPCVDRGTDCDNDHPCCDDLACDSSSKKCMGGTGGYCDDDNKCSSDHTCNPTTNSCYPNWCLDLGFLPLPQICIPVQYREVFYPPNN